MSEEKILNNKRKSTINESEGESQIEDDFTVLTSISLEKKNKILSKKNLLKLAGSFFVLVILGVAIYSSYELYKIKNPAYQQKLLDNQNKKIVLKVGKLIELPDEVPQIAVVSDAEALKKTQPFFSKATNGDNILIFTNEAILYNPGKNKIINIAPVNRQDAETKQVLPTSNATEKVSH